LLVLWDRATSAGVPASVVPSNFTSIRDFNDCVGLKCILSAKIAVGTEASASLTGMNGSSTNRKCLYVFRGSRLIAAFTAQDIASEATDNNPPAQTVNASAGVVPLIVLGCYGLGQNALIDPRTFTVGGVGAKDGEITSDQRQFLAYKIYNSAPADVVIDMDDEHAYAL
jgi:hypothetical protein